VIAWCSLNAFNYRTCYDGVADLSIYVARRYRGRGVGRVMLQHLLDTARELNYYKLVLATLAHNEVGVRLYQHFGFKEVGIYRRHGRIHDCWVDMRIMELFIGEE
jgi:L-amino acid N-acyltransferase YncA